MQAQGLLELVLFGSWPPFTDGFGRTIMLRASRFEALVGGSSYEPTDHRLCSTRGDIFERFHLLLHATLGVLAACIAAFVYRRRRLFGWWPPEAA
jgi:hypothetical protein